MVKSLTAKLDGWAQGYATGHFGKWHIGPEQKPGTCGIDAIGSSEEEQGGKKKREDDRGRDAHIYDEAIQFIEQHEGGPFFVNVWGHIPHNPVNPTDALVKRWTGLKVEDGDFPAQMLGKFDDVRKACGDLDDGMRRYLADIESLDDSVGRLLKRLDQLGLRENTIVVFNSDQGADMTKAGGGGLRFNQMGCNGAQHGGKHTHWQGGNGTNQIALAQLATQGSVKITGGTGHDSIEAGFSLAIKKNLIVALGEGEGAFESTSLDTRIGGLFSYTGGSGKDTVTFAPSAIFTIGGGMSITTGAGTAHVDFGGDHMTIGKKFTFDSSGSSAVPALTQRS